MSRVRLRPPLVVAGAAVIVVALYLPTFGLAGFEMDEGTLVAYPEFVRSGLIPAQDFATFYGPGQPWLTAGVFEVFGASVEAARVVGLALRLALILAIVFLGLRYGAGTALVAGVSGAIVLLPLGSAPYAIVGAVAVTVVALAALLEAVLRERDGRPPLGFAIGAGLAGAVAMTFRWDIALALGPCLLPALVLCSSRLRRAFAGAFALGLVPLLVWAAVLGLDGIDTVVGELVASRPGRRLPLSEMSQSSAVALVGGVAGLLAGAATGLISRKRGELDHAIAPASLALLALGLLPSALQRVDAAHILPFAVVGLAAAVLSASALARLLGWRPVAATGLGLGALVLSVGATQSFFRHGLLEADETNVEVGGRSFPIRSATAAGELNSVLAELDSVATDDQTLFVGPRDLSRTNYTDTFVYYLLPRLAPASRFTEVNAGVTNDSDSGLAADLAGADYVLLAGRWDDWDEPNASDEAGSAESNDVVEESFELIASNGSYKLYAHD